VAAMSMVHAQVSFSQLLLQPNLKQLEKVRVNY
jgi:hypothetical protein